jgi:hypothetical protein
MVASLDQILAQDPERARESLRGILGDRIKLQPDESGRFLWAEYSLGLSALVSNAEIMVAGAGFANFRQRVTLDRRARPPWAAAAHD